MADVDFPTGTKRLYDEQGLALSRHSDLKKHGDIILAPQPTNHPDDPLHWGSARKYWHAFLLLLLTAVTAATTNDATSAQDGQNAELGVSYDALNVGAGILFCAIGYWTFLISPAVWLYGRRITYLICMTLGLFGGIWFALANNTSNTQWNQLFVGASESCSEALVQLSLMDVFFQHQRGAVLGAYMFAISAGTYVGPLIASVIATNMGWRWIGWFGAIISGFMLVLLYFGLEETAFDRNKYLTLEGVSVSEPKENGYPTPAMEDVGLGATSSSSSDVKDKEAADAGLARRSSNQVHPSSHTRKTYRQRIALITRAENVRGTGFKQYFSRLFHTLRIFTFPAVWFAGLQWGAQDAFLTFYLTTEGDVWYLPPWNYSDIMLGRMNVPCLIGAIIGCAYGGWFSDRFMRWMTKRNGGIQEPEMRLWLLLPAAIIFPTGLILFGVGTAYEWAWPVPIVALGFIGFGWGNAGDLSMAYLEDSYPDMVLEGMVGVAVINNTIGMIFTFTADPWLSADGTLDTYIAIGVLSFAFLATTAPMMIWGKACRRMTMNRYKQFLMLRDGL